MADATGSILGLYTEFKGFGPLISCRGPQSLVKLILSGEPRVLGQLPMKRRLGKVVIISLELVALVVALLAIAGFVAHRKISHGGLTLAPVKAHVESLLERRFADGSEVQLGGIYLIQERNTKGELGPVRLIVHDLVVKTETGETALDLSELALLVETADLMRGNISPHHVEITNAAISIRRLKNGDYDFGLQRGEQKGEPENAQTTESKNFLEALLTSSDNPNASPLIRLFRGATLRDASLKFVDEVSGQVWRAEGVEAKLYRHASGKNLSGEITAPVDFDGTLSNLKLLIDVIPDAEEISATLAFDDAPMRNIVGMILGQKFADKFDAAATGTIEIKTSLHGSVQSAFLYVEANNGTITLKDVPIMFAGLKLATVFDPATRHFQISQLNWTDVAGNQGHGSGDIWLLPSTPLASQAPDSLKFDLDLADIVLDLPKVMQEPLPISKARAQGVVEIASKTLDISSLTLNYHDAVIEGTVRLAFTSGSEKLSDAAAGNDQEPAGQSPAIKTKARLTGGVSPKQILQGWPIALAPAARLWVDANLIDGAISNVDFAMDIPIGAIKVGHGIGDDAMALTFDFEDASSEYVPGLTPISNASGSAKILGNSLVLNTTKGRVGSLNLIKGSVDIPEFYPKGGPAWFRADLGGSTREMLRIIDEKPLQFITKAGMKPESFSGNSIFTIQVMRPMRGVVPIENYVFKGSGDFANLVLEDFIPDYDLENAAGNLTLTNQGVKIKGDAEIRGTPVKVDWERSFSGDKTTFIKARGVMDALAADAFGLPLRQFIRGEVDYTLSTFSNEKTTSDIKIKADLTKTIIDFSGLNWRKSVGTPGTLTFNMTPPSQGGGKWLFKKINLDTEGLLLIGGFDLLPGWHLDGLDFNRIFVKDRADFSIKTSRAEDGSVKAVINGTYANVDIFLSEFFKGSGTRTKLPAGISLDVTLNRLGLKNNIAMSGFSAFMKHDGQALADMSVAGHFTQGGVMSVGFQKETAGSHTLILKTDNVGAATNGLFGISSLRDGSATVIATKFLDGPISGKILASDFRIFDAPLIARIFSAGSFDGLSDLLNDAGIEFTEMESQFHMEKGVLSIEDARATGPSVGLSGNGDVDFSNSLIDLNGAMAPAYAVNSVLGNIPGFGEILVSRKGEGLVAVSYAVDGAVTSPTITVNALSALTPGILRRIFEPIRHKKPTTEELLKLAIEEAELLEHREGATSAEELMELEKGLE